MLSTCTLIRTPPRDSVPNTNGHPNPAMTPLSAIIQQYSNTAQHTHHKVLWWSHSHFRWVCRSGGGMRKGMGKREYCTEYVTWMATLYEQLAVFQTAPRE